MHGERRARRERRELDRGARQRVGRSGERPRERRGDDGGPHSDLKYVSSASRIGAGELLGVAHRAVDRDEQRVEILVTPVVEVRRRASDGAQRGRVEETDAIALGPAPYVVERAVREIAGVAVAGRAAGGVGLEDRLAAPRERVVDLRGGRRGHRPHPRDERVAIGAREAGSAESSERRLQMRRNVDRAAAPAVRRAALEAAREHRRLPRAVVRRPDEAVVASVGVAARADPPVLRDAGVGVEEELATARERRVHRVLGWNGDRRNRERRRARRGQDRDASRELRPDDEPLAFRVERETGRPRRDLPFARDLLLRVEPPGVELAHLVGVEAREEEPRAVRNHRARDHARGAVVREPNERALTVRSGLEVDRRRALFVDHGDVEHVVRARVAAAVSGFGRGLHRRGVRVSGGRVRQRVRDEDAPFRVLADGDRVRVVRLAREGACRQVAETSLPALRLEAPDLRLRGALREVDHRERVAGGVRHERARAVVGDRHGARLASDVDRSALREGRRVEHRERVAPAGRDEERRSVGRPREADRVDRRVECRDLPKRRARRAGALDDFDLRRVAERDRDAPVRQRDELRGTPIQGQRRISRSASTSNARSSRSSSSAT